MLRGCANESYVGIRRDGNGPGVGIKSQEKRRETIHCNDKPSCRILSFCEKVIIENLGTVLT